MISIAARLLRGAYRLVGAKKAFALPEDALRREIDRQNRHRGVFTPTDHKAYYETITVEGFPCLIVRQGPEPAARAILYCYGGGMVICPSCASWAGMRAATCGSPSIRCARSIALPKPMIWFTHAIAA